MSIPDTLVNSPAAPARMLVIDDELQIRRFLDISLRAQGYEVSLAETAQAGLEFLAARGAEIVILDLGLPDRDGLDALRELRLWSKVPVIVLTVRASEAEKVAALDAGANDYVTKPFGVQELLARIRVLLRLRLVASDASPIFDDGHLRIDVSSRMVSLDGQPIALSRKEYALLALLFAHAGRVVTQPQMLRELWGPTHVQDTHYLRILVAKLRQKIGDDATSPRWIATEPGVGLRFIANG
jgi:two-component system, OmpR family, KDP operon response regulator KdpE